MLRELEERKADLSVSSYGLSMTTLEEARAQLLPHGLTNPSKLTP